MIETEIKVEINNPDVIRNKIEALNGIYKLTLEHKDTYYNMPLGLRDFQKTDEALRIRDSTQFNKHKKKETTNSQYFFTFKGKKLDKLTKTREENEVKIDNILQIKKILTELGFREIFTVIKKRELYEIPFEGLIIEILIDYLPVLEKYFIELELIVESSEEITFAQNVLFRLLNNFGFSKSDSIRKSYLELIFEYYSKKSKD